MKRAWKNFQKLNPSDALTDFIVEKVQHQKRTIWGGVEVRFIPGLARYLEEERWTDDVSEVAPYGADELAKARNVIARRYLGRCPHNPTCEDNDTCLKAIAQRQRDEHRRSA